MLAASRARVGRRGVDRGATTRDGARAGTPGHARSDESPARAPRSNFSNYQTRRDPGKGGGLPTTSGAGRHAVVQSLLTFERTRVSESAAAALFDTRARSAVPVEHVIGCRTCAQGSEIFALIEGSPSRGKHILVPSTTVIPPSTIPPDRKEQRCVERRSQVARQTSAVDN